MSRSKIDRALYGPSLFEVTLGAALSIALGAVVAFVFLVLKPVIVVKDTPKEEERVQGAVYFVEGNRDPLRSKQLPKKRQLLNEGTPGEIAFTEEELNAWFSSAMPEKPEKVQKPVPAKPAPAPKGAKAAPAPAPAPDIPEELLTFEALNVRIRDGVFQVGIPTSINLKMLTMAFPVVVQTRGTFEKQADMWMFKPSEMYLGSMPLHRIPGFTDALVKRVMRSSLVPDEAITVWKRVSNVAVDGKQLKLTIEQPTAPAPETTG